MSAAPARAVSDHATFYLRAAVEALCVPKAFALDDDARKSTRASVHYVVHVCPNTNKTSAKSVFDLLDAAKSDAIPAELKSFASASDALALKKFTTTVAIDERIAFEPSAHAVALDSAADKALDAVQQQLLPLVQRVQGAIGILKNRGGGGKKGPIAVQLISPVPAAMASPADKQVRYIYFQNGFTYFIVLLGRKLIIRLCFFLWRLYRKCVEPEASVARSAASPTYWQL